MADVQIDEVHTEVVITDTVGPLSPEDMRKLVREIMEHLQMAKDHAERKQADDSVGNRNYVSDVRRGH